jgi:DNA-binding transcriptional LysR family regulator
MIEAGVGIGILPESAASRYRQTTDVRLVQLEDEWAVRRMQICVRSLELLPAFARELVELLRADAAA